MLNFFGNWTLSVQELRLSKSAQQNNPGYWTEKTSIGKTSS